MGEANLVELAPGVRVVPLYNADTPVLPGWRDWLLLALRNKPDGLAEKAQVTTRER